MATSFVEQAILRVQDQSTKPIRRINAELKKLRDTARNMKSVSLISPASLRSLDTAERKVMSLRNQLRSLPKSRTVTISTKLTGTGRGELNNLVARKPLVNVRMKISNAAAFRQEVDRLTRNRTMNVRVNANPGSGGASPNYRIQGQTFGAGVRHAFQPENAGNTMARGFIGYAGAHLSSMIIDAVATGIREGVTDFSVSDATRQILGVSPEDQEGLDALAIQLSDLFPEFSQGQIERILTDAYGAAQGNLKTTTALINELLITARQTFLQGGTADTATEGGNLLFTAAEATGITGPDGNIDLEQLAKAMEDFRVGAALVGEAFSPSKTKTFYTRLAQVAPRFDSDAIAEGLLLQEAGVTANDLLAFTLQFGTAQQGTDEAKAFRARYGLDSREAMEAADTNQIAFFQDYVVPAFQKALEDGFEGDIGEFVEQATSRQTAARTGQVIATQGQEIQNRVDRREDLNVDDEGLAAIAAENQRAVAQALSAQFDSAISRTVEGMAPLLNPVFQKAADSLNFAADQAQENPVAAAATLAATTVVLREVLGPLTNLNSLQALLDPATSAADKALISASLKLDGAADKLTLSALLMRGTFGLGGGLKSLAKGFSVIGGAVGGLSLVTDFLGTNAGDGSLTAEGMAFSNAPADVQQQLADIETAIAEANNRGDVQEADQLRAQGRLLYEGWRDSADGQAALAQAQATLAPINMNLGDEDTAMSQPVEFNLSEEGKAKIERLLGVMERNNERISEPGRSEASINSLLAQQDALADQILALGGTPLELDPTNFVDAGYDVGTMLSTTIDGAMQSGGDYAGDTMLTSGMSAADLIGQAMEQAGSNAARMMAEALNTPVRVDARVETPRLGPRLDTGRTSPQ